jgi:PLD-like domain
MGKAQEQVLTFARELLLARIAGAKSRIWLASPFISTAIASEICEVASRSGAAERRLLTDLDERAVRCGVLDPEALAKLRGYDFDVASIANLHAKVSLIDAWWGLVGSGNLTGAGLGGEFEGGNYEMGVLLDPAQRRMAREIFERWWARAEMVDADQIAEFEELPRLPKSFSHRVGPTISPPMDASLAEILVEDPSTAASRKYWINANYYDPDDEMWWHRGWVSDGSKKLYGKGDLLVIYLGKENNGPQLCPAILRVDKPPQLEREFVLEERDLEAATRWPYVTRTSRVAEVSPFEGVPLEVAGKSYLSVENGCELSRAEFEKLALALSMKSTH